MQLQKAREIPWSKEYMISFFSANKYMLRVTIETLEKDKKHVQS